MPIATDAAAPRPLAVARPTLTLDAHLLRDVSLTGWAYGPPPGTAPVVVIVGGITASPFPFGRPAAGGEDAVEAWWPALAGPERIDITRTTVLCPCWPGHGSTWLGFDDEDLPPLSVSGLADLVAQWLDGIGCTVPVTFIGASLGGMVGLAFAVRHPTRCARLVTISAGARPDGWGTATRHLQRELVRDGWRNGEVATGMSRARQLGMLTYRGRDELDTRFGALGPGLARPPVADYLEHHGRRFAERFPVRTFLLLSEAIDRGALADTPDALRTAMASVTAETIVVGVPGDMLFPWALQEEVFRHLQAVGAHSSLWKLDSEYGHDAFLADQDRLAAVLDLAGAFGPEPVQHARPRFEGVGEEPVRELRLGLIGCGTVGQGLLEMLERQADAVRERYGVRFRVTRIAVRNLAAPRGPRADGIPRTDHALAVVSDPEVDVVVEVAGGLALAPVLRAALAAGKPVVTANKVLLASMLADLGVLAQRTATPLYCEAAAAAAIPIIRHLSHRADEVDSLAGILNGTCNFVITRMEQEEMSLEAALTEARRRGFAEADATADLDGSDAAAKLSILAYRAFGAWVRPGAFPVRGIDALTPHDCDLAEALGHRIRLIARAARLGDALDIAVEPLLLPAWHLLASVEEEYNAVYLRGAASGDLSLFGKGAGALPTATAVLGDLIDLAQDNSVRWPEPQPLPLVDRDHRGSALARRHYLRVSASAHPGLDRRIDRLVRHAGLAVQDRGVRADAGRVHLGLLISPSSEAAIETLRASLSSLARVDACLALGVGE